MASIDQSNSTAFSSVSNLSSNSTEGAYEDQSIRIALLSDFCAEFEFSQNHLSHFLTLSKKTRFQNFVLKLKFSSSKYAAIESLSELRRAIAAVVLKEVQTSFETIQ